MSQNALELMRTAFDRWNGRDLKGVAEFLDPAVEFVEDPRFPEAGTYRGHDEVLRYLSEFAAQFDEIGFTVEEVLDAGPDTYLVCLHIKGRGSGSGAEFEARAGWIFTLCGATATRIRAYLDRAEALEAAGLSVSD